MKFAKTKGDKEPQDDQLDDNYQETAKWYEEDLQEPQKFSTVTEQILIELKEEAKKCHDAEVANYNISKWSIFVVI